MDDWENPVRHYCRKGRFLQPLKHGTYNCCRLNAYEESL